MSKKIGTFLMIMVVMCALLLLMATAGRKAQPQPETTAAAETAVPDEQPTEPQALETDSAAEQVSAAAMLRRSGSVSPETRSWER